MYNSDGLIRSSKPPQTANVQRVTSQVDIESLVRSIACAAIALSQQRQVDAAVMDRESMEEVTWSEISELLGTVWNVVMYRIMNALMATSMDGETFHMWMIMGGGAIVLLFVFMIFYMGCACGNVEP